MLIQKETIEANMKELNFLDITLNLTTGVYKPYMKENDHPVYVNTKSKYRGKHERSQFPRYYPQPYYRGI